MELSTNRIDLIIIVVYLVGILLIGILSGLVLGIAAFCLDFEPISGQMNLTSGIGMPFMMQAWWLFVTCTILYCIFNKQ